MRKYIRQLQIAYEWAYFDSKFYRLVHWDVTKASQGKLFFLYNHYRRFGKTENRRIRKRPLPFFSLPIPVITKLRSKDNYLSGMSLHTKQSQLHGIGWLFIFELPRFKLQIRNKINFDSFSSRFDNLHTIYWDPIQHSQDRTYLAFIVIMRRFRISLLAHVPHKDLAHSNPNLSGSLPGSIVLGPVTACNLNCPHCLSQFTRGKVSQLSDKNWEDIRPHIRSGGIKQISSDYSGDIFFTQKKYGPWLDRLLDSNAELALNTHANDLSSHYTHRIMDANISYINFSIDCMIPELYQKIRKGARPLNEVLEDIEQFMTIRNQKRPDLKVCISLALRRSTLSSLEPAIEFAARHKISWVQGNHLMVYNISTLEDSVLLDMTEYDSYYQRANRKADEFKVRLAMPPPFKASQHRTGHAPCTVPWGSAVILGNGDVLPCCMEGPPVGNLNYNSLEEIFDGPKMREFKGKVNTPNPPDQCDRCAYYRFDNNFESYVPGLNQEDRKAFVTRVLSQPWFQQA